MSRSCLCAAIAAVIALSAPGVASAHSLDLAVVDVRELSPGNVAVSAVVSTGANATEMPLQVVLPADCTVTLVAPLTLGDGQLTARWLAQCAETLRGKTLAIRWTSGEGNAMVRVHLAGGDVIARLVTTSEPSVDLSAGDTSEPFAGVAMRYTRLGVQHISGGIDHLLFVFGLILLCRRRSTLIATITAFTVGHSVTLSVAALGLVRVPSAPIEAVIALSIVFVAVELAGEPNEQSSMRRRPWLIAGAFGLLHGLGFAGALSELGVSSETIVPALLGFNLGVEIGQLMFVGAVVTIAWLARRVFEAPAWAGRALAYGMGSISMMWLFDRVAAF